MSDAKITNSQSTIGKFADQAVKVMMPPIGSPPSPLPSPPGEGESQPVAVAKVPVAKAPATEEDVAAAVAAHIARAGNAGSPLAGNQPSTAAWQPAKGWNVDSRHAGHKGGKADVLALIRADEKIPAHWRAAIVAEIEALDCQAVRVSAHCSRIHEDVVVSLHLKKLF